MRPRCHRDVDGVGGRPTGEVVVEHDLVRHCGGVDRPQDVQERLVGRIVRPQGEHPARTQLRGQAGQTGALVERRVAGVQHVVGGVVDVEQHDVDRTQPARRRIGEEVALDEHASRVVREPCGVREQTSPVPADDLGQRVDDAQGPHPVVLEGGERRAAQTQATDHDVEVAAVVSGETKPGQLRLGDGEQARHEELLTEPHLVDVHVQRRLTPTPQDQFAHAGRRDVELFDAPGHEDQCAARVRAG